MEKHKGVHCQSCSMPMTRASERGTDSLGQHVDEFCRHCYREGRFTEPTLTAEQMIERLSVMSDVLHMSPAQARRMGEHVLPRLARWRPEAPAATPAAN